LDDAFAHLRGVRDLESTYFQSLRGSSEPMDPDAWIAARRAFAETTGYVVDRYEQVMELPGDQQQVFHLLLTEPISYIRVIFGYDGFKTEKGFRRSLFDQLEKQIEVPGFGPGSSPQLMVSGGYTTCKANGQPFSAPLHARKWPFLFSAALNPMQLLLECLWTRLAREYQIGGLWGQDLELENLHAFLLAVAGEMDGRWGWHFEYVTASDAELAKQSDLIEWQPEFLSETQFVVINRLCSGATVRLDDPDFLGFLSEAGLQVERFKQQILETRSVGLRGNELRLITSECHCAILPSGEFVAAENNTGRLTRWLRRRLSAEQPVPRECDADT